jgi:hypothetical protein
MNWGYGACCGAENVIDRREFRGDHSASQRNSVSHSGESAANARERAVSCESRAK